MRTTKTDQTAPMRRLICVFAGCTGNLVGNAVPWLLNALYVKKTTPQSLYNTTVGIHSINRVS